MRGDRDRPTHLLPWGPFIFFDGAPVSIRPILISKRMGDSSSELVDSGAGGVTGLCTLSAWI